MRHYVALMQGNVPNYGHYTLGFTNFNCPYPANEFIFFTHDAPWCTFDNAFVRSPLEHAKYKMDLTPLYETSPVELDPARWFFEEVGEAEYKNGIFLMKLPEFVTLSDG